MREFDCLTRFLAEAGITGLKSALHVGAGNGIQDDKHYRAMGIKPTYVEPDPRSLAILQKRLAGREVVPVALGDYNGEATLHKISLCEASSLLPPTPLLFKSASKSHPKIASAGTQPVAVRRADNVFGGRTFDLIVIDVQGGELDVLRGAERILKTARVVMVEVFHDRMYQKSPLKADVTEFLSKQGFSLVGESPGGAAYGDAIYFRTSEWRPKITLFGCIAAQRGPVALRQWNALKTWSFLGPNCDVVLLGNSDGAAELAREMGFRHAPNIKKAPGSNTYMFDDYFRAMKESCNTELMMHVCSDNILLPDFEATVNRIHAAHIRRPALKDFVGIGYRLDVPVSEKLVFGLNWINGVRRCLIPKGEIQRSAINYCVFNRDLWNEWPPFIAWRTWEDYWWGFDALRRSVPLVNMTSSFKPIHPIHAKHDYTLDKNTKWLSERGHNEQFRHKLGMRGSFAGNAATWIMTPKEIKQRTDSGPRYRPVITSFARLVEHISRVYDSVLNIGCGPTAFLRHIKCKTRVGTDVCKRALAKARNRMKANGQNVKYVQGDLKNLGKLFKADSFGAVIGLDVIEHLPKQTALGVIAACENISLEFIAYFIPVGNMPYSRDQWNLGNEYHMTHKSSWEPQEMADLGYEVWHFPDWHKGHKHLQPGSSRAAMWCVKLVDNVAWAGAGKVHELMRFGKVK